MKTASSALVAVLLSVSAVKGFAAGEAVPARAVDLLPPVQVTAAGEPIVVDGRCAGLTMGDFDNDGKLDLLVGQMSEGRLRIYLNTGTATHCKFGEATDFMAGGERACLPTGCYTAINPQLVDFDGDGRIDLLSPSFNSGIYLFRRAADGKFTEAEMFDDRHGRPIEFRYNGAALAYDWDADDDPDLIVRGGHVGVRYGVSLIINEGNSQTPAFGEPQLLRVDGSRVNAKPCAIVDWDGDGRDDLLTCSGSAYWYRNTGEKGKPVLQPAEVLIPSGVYRSIKRSSETPQRLPDQPGRIDSICVADFNGDGRLDLLATSSWGETVEAPESTEKKQDKKTIQDRSSSLSRKCRELIKPIENESRDARIKRQREFLRVWKEYAAVRAELRAFHSHHDYSCVWLYERTTGN